MLVPISSLILLWSSFFFLLFFLKDRFDSGEYFVTPYLQLSRETEDVVSVRGIEQFFRSGILLAAFYAHDPTPALPFPRTPQLDLSRPKQFRLIMLSVGTIWNRKHKSEIIVRSIKKGGGGGNPAWAHPAAQTRFKIGSAKKEIFQIQ